jgi:mono/diheme cytochrome c family protein
MLTAGTTPGQRGRNDSIGGLIAMGILTGTMVAGALTLAMADEAVPPDYASKTMPANWLGDTKVLAEGKEIYEGKLKPEVNCAKCHGSDGKPTKLGKGAPDLSHPSDVSTHSDTHWFWRISEKKPGTTMPGYKDKLTEEQRWQVIVHLRTLVQSGK